jgi:hypothetical protein
MASTRIADRDGEVGVAAVPEVFPAPAAAVATSRVPV